MQVQPFGKTGSRTPSSTEIHRAGSKTGGASTDVEFLPINSKHQIMNVASPAGGKPKTIGSVSLEGGQLGGNRDAFDGNQSPIIRQQDR